LVGLPALHSVYLVGLPITDQTLVAGTKITDAGLESIKKMPSLRFVSLQDTAVTPEGIDALKNAMPLLQVVPARRWVN
jgi:hypothetical protein